MIILNTLEKAPYPQHNLGSSKIPSKCFNFTTIDNHILLVAFSSLHALP